MKKFTLQAVIIVLLFISNTATAQPKSETAPETFTAKFETTKGDFVIEVHRKHSPKAADRLYSLIKSGYYDNTLFYRAVPYFVVQFGNPEAKLTKQWEAVKVPDEPVLFSNKKGTISFARAGVETRSTDLFINLKDNTFLDTVDYDGVKGFPAFGIVIQGMDVVEKLYAGYGDTTMEDEKLLGDREQFLKAFPLVDSIKRAFLL